MDGQVLAVVDAPFWMHWRKAWLWLFMEAVVVAAAVLTNNNSNRWTDQLTEAEGADCTGDTRLDCKKGGEGAALNFLFAACVAACLQALRKTRDEHVG